MSNLLQPGMTTEKLESFVNDYLRVDLAEYEKHLNKLNTDIMEYIQLKNMAESINTHLKDGFKTQVNVGGNCFIQAKIENTEMILVNVGLEHYVEFTIPEAIQFCNFKIKMLTNQAEIVREESISTRANIKLALMCLGDKTKLYNTK